MESTLTNLAFELLVLCAFGLAYYLWQRRRILKGPPGWRESKIVELHHRALDCPTPEQFPDINDFIAALEAKLVSETSELDESFLRHWTSQRLPPDVIATMEECLEWLGPAG